MYVKAYLDLSVKSLVCCGCDSRPVHLGAWPGGSWLPWLRPFCCFVVLVWFLRDFRRNGPVLRFTFSPAQWAPPQLNGPVQLLSIFLTKTVD